MADKLGGFRLRRSSDPPRILCRSRDHRILLFPDLAKVSDESCDSPLVHSALRITLRGRVAAIEG